MDDSSPPRRAVPRPSVPALVAGFAALYLVWGSTYLGIKIAVETLPPLLMAGGRFLLAGGVLYALLRWHGVASPTLRQWRPAAITGALLLLGGNGLVTWGQQHLPTGRAALIVATTPLWMVLLSWLFYQGERPGLRVWLGMAAGFAGAVLLIRAPAGTATPAELPAALALAAAPIAWSIGSLESRRRGTGENILMTSALQMLAGGTMMALVGTLSGEWSVVAARSVSIRSVSAFFYLAVFGGLVGFSTYAWLLRVASPTAVSTYAFVNPLVAVFLGWLIAGEGLDPWVLVAATLIIGAVVLITIPRAAHQMQPRLGLRRLWFRRRPAGAVVHRSA